MNERYARIFEEAIKRKDEVTSQEFWVHFLIIFHSDLNKDGLRVCEMEVHDICKIHKLAYANTQRRIMRLRTGTFAEHEPVKKVAKMKTPWIYKTNAKHFLPLVGIKKEEIVKNTIFMREEIVKNTTASCKKYNKSPEEIVKNTIAYNKDLNSFLNSFINSSAATEIAAAAAAEINLPLSKFEKQDCLRYAIICKDRGEPIRSVHALAKYAHETGKLDVDIQTALYPEKTLQTPELIVPDMDFDDLAPDPLSEEARSAALIVLRGMLKISSLDGLLPMKVNYTEDDWQWLMAQLAK